MKYELMEVSTGNLIGIFPTELAALKVVSDTVERYGEGAVETWALGLDRTPDAAGETLADGPELARRAKELLGRKPSPR